jgi:hypothetical protein
MNNIFDLDGAMPLAQLFGLELYLGLAVLALHEHDVCFTLFSWILPRRHPSNDYQPVGGLIFPGKATPDYWDFLYFSFVVGNDLPGIGRSDRRSRAKACRPGP